MYKSLPNNEIGSFIQRAREARGMSRNELADRCEISRTEIVRIEEGGRKQPSINNLRKISEVLYISYEDLIALAGYIPPADKSFLEFSYPALNTASRLEAAERLIEIFSMEQLSDAEIDLIVKNAELVVAANQNHR